MSEPEDRVCDQCGAPLGRHAREGFCSRCLARNFPMADERLEQESEPENEKHEVRVHNPEAGGQPVIARFGDYELLEEIAHGGMGVVYRARQLSLKRIVAVKMLLCGQFVGKHGFDRFRIEAQTAASLQHPNIVAIHAIGETDGQPYFSMDYVAGRNLGEMVRERPLSALQAAVYLRKIAMALHYAHTQGVLHRDLKPANVLIDENDEPRVTDFGIARRLMADSEFTMTGQLLGSPNFMPPEQGAGKKTKLGPTADVYGLGALLYYLLTARPPFMADSLEGTLAQVLNNDPVSPRYLNPRLPLDLETICLKCLEKNPERRYASALRLADELDRFIKGEPIRARAIGMVGKTWRWCQRKPVVAGLMAAVLASLIAVTAVSLNAARRIRAEARRTEAHARNLRLNLYVADMNVAYQAIQDNNYEMARQLLDNYRPPQTEPGKSLDEPGKAQEEDLRGWEWRYLWGLSHGDSIAVLRGHAGAVTCAVLAADGKTLITGGLDRTVRVWDMNTGRTVRVLTGFAGRLYRNSVALAPDGTFLAVADGRDIHVFESTGWTNVCIIPNEASSGYVESLPIAFSPDGRALSCNAATEIRHWDTSSWKQIGSCPTNLLDEFCFLLTYSPDKRHFATAKHEGIAIWDTSSEPPGQRLLGPLHWPFVICFSPDGRMVAAGGVGGEAVIWDVAQTKVLRRFSLGERATLTTAIAWSPDGRQLASVGDDEAIHLWDIGQSRLIATLKNPYGGSAGLTYLPDGRTLASACGDGTIRLFSTRRQEMPGAVMTTGILLSFTSDGSTLAILGTNFCIEYWDVRSRRTVGTFRIPRDVHPRDCVAASLDGNMAALVSIDGLAQVWDVRTGQEIDTLPLNPAPVLPLTAFSPDNERLVICCNTRTRGGGGWTLVWDFRRGEVQRLPGHDVYRPSFSLDGKRLAAASDNNVRVWSLPELKLLASFQGHSSTINGIAFSPDGARLASMERELTIRTWNIDTWRPELLFSTKSRGNGIGTGAFSTDGRTLVSGSNFSPDLWNVATGRKILSLRNTPKFLTRPMFSPDGRVLALGRSDDARDFQPVVLLEAPSLAEIEATEKSGRAPR